jgi:gamma-glutamylcyclotransferase
MNPNRIRERNISFSKRVHSVLKNYSLKFNKVASHSSKKGYANIVPEKNGVVEGVLYDVSDSDLPKLDRYEGHPDHYDRIDAKVQLDNKREVEAVTYIAQSDKVREGLIPSKNYLDHLLAASDVLSKSYLDKLKSQETLGRKNGCATTGSACML